MDAVLGLGRALPDPRGLPAIGRITPQPGFLAMQSIGQPRRISYGGGAASAVWMIFVLLSTPTCAFPPNYHWWSGASPERAAAAGS